MTIFLVRHGQYNPKWIDESEGLSEKGITEVKLLRSLLDEENIFFDTVISSPINRAYQTAEILSGGRPITIVKELSPTSSSELAYNAIKEEGNTLVVTHLPILEGICERFGESLNFSPASMAIFSDGELKKVITPSAVGE